jgi:hypothetical protein
MRQISRGEEGYIIILKISLQVPEMFIKKVIFWLKSNIFPNKCCWGMVYLKLKGHKKSLEGRMRPAGRTLAMSDIGYQVCTWNQTLLHVSIFLD